MSVARLRRHKAPHVGVRKFARIRSLSGRSDALRSALLTLEEATAAEPGCVEFSFFQSLADPEAFLLLEHFTSECALAAHLSHAHTRAFFALGLTSTVAAQDLP